MGQDGPWGTPLYGGIHTDIAGSPGTTEWAQEDDMDRRKALATTGAITLTATAAVVALGSSMGLFGLTDDGGSRIGKLSPVDATSATTQTSVATLPSPTSTTPNTVPDASPATTPNTLATPGTTTNTLPDDDFFDDHGGDRDDDHDNSGHGSGDDDDDNSGHGGGDDDSSGHGGDDDNSGRDHPEDD